MVPFRRAFISCIYLVGRYGCISDVVCLFVCMSCISSSGNNLAFKSVILKFLFHLCAFLFSLFPPREMHLFIVSEDAHLTLRNLLHNQFSAIS